MAIGLVVNDVFEIKINPCILDVAHCLCLMYWRMLHEPVQDSEVMTNMFNYYFIVVGIGYSIAESIVGINNKHLHYMAHVSQPNSFSFRQMHCYSTEKIIHTLKNKSSNLNTIPDKILKSICDNYPMLNEHNQ